MNCMDTTETRQRDAASECVIQMPLGLLGFEQFKRFALVTNPAEEPFLWLQVIDQPKLTFLVLSPFVVLPTYQPEIPGEDARFLDLQDPSDTLIFNIVTLRGAQQATVNLKGPIVLNRRTLRAKQVIPINAPEFSVAHPLPVQAG
jgi:flagellar assembly factor FliW